MGIIKKIKKVINMSLDRTIEILEEKSGKKRKLNTSEFDQAFNETQDNIKKIRENIKRSQIN